MDKSSKSGRSQNGATPSPSEALEGGVSLAKQFLHSLRRPKGSEIEVGLMRIDAEMDMVRRQGFWGMMRLRWEAWLEEQMKDPAIRKMKARQEILEEQRKTAESHIKLKTTIQSGEREVEVGQIQHDQFVFRQLRSDLDSSRMLIPAGESEPTMASSSAGPSMGSPVVQHISDEEIESLALQTVMVVGTGEGAEERWREYRDEIYRQMPPYVAQEVERRVEAMRKVVA